MSRRVPRFGEVLYHRLKYFLSPQLDLYRNVAREFGGCERCILDYGCGTGIGAIVLVDRSGYAGGNSVCGVDCDADAVRFADEIFGSLADFRIEDWARSPASHPLGPFDLVTCIEVVEHVEDPEPLIRAIRDNMRDDGVLVISTLNHNSQYRKNDLHVCGYTVKTFRNLLATAFPHVVTCDYTLRNAIGDESTVTPVVAVCRKL